MPSSYEIYQTYLRGPASVIRLFKQSLGTHAIYGAPDQGVQKRTIESLSEESGRLQNQVARVQPELRETRGDNHRLRQGGVPEGVRASVHKRLYGGNSAEQAKFVESLFRVQG